MSPLVDASWHRSGPPLGRPDRNTGTADQGYLTPVGRNRDDALLVHVLEHLDGAAALNEELCSRVVQRVRRHDSPSLSRRAIPALPLTVGLTTDIRANGPEMKRPAWCCNTGRPEQPTERSLFMTQITASEGCRRSRCGPDRDDPMTAHKAWCTCDGTSVEGSHVCSTQHHGFQIDAGVVRVSVVAWPGDEPMVCLHQLDDDGETLVLDAKDARELASLLTWHAAKAEALTEHNHQPDGNDVFFPDCLACRRTARLAALAGQKEVTE